MSEKVPERNEPADKPDRSSGQKEISYRRLVFESTPELWLFHVFSAFVLLIMSSLLFFVINRIAETNGSAITTANIKSLLLSWRLPVLLLVVFVLVSVYIIIEILAQLHFSYDILEGKRAGVFRELKKAFPDINRFLNPSGIGVIVFQYLAVPLIGIGFGISLSESFGIPRFMMNFILKTPLLLIGIVALYVFLIITGIRWLFVFHAVLIDGMTPAAGKKQSTKILKEHWKPFLLHFLKLLLFSVIIYLGICFVFGALPRMLLTDAARDLPAGYPIGTEQLKNSAGLTSLDLAVIGHRILCAMNILFSRYFVSLFCMLVAANTMMLITRDYLAFTRGEELQYQSRPRKRGFVISLIIFIGAFVLLALGSVVLGILYTPLFGNKEPVKIIAHRCGGNLAAENSLEGVRQAIEHGCYGSETDIQRTKDGFYIINHDNTFERLCGVPKASQDMTLAEIRSLTLKDENGEAPVPSLEELLDAAKDREVLYLELKGETADEKMADDVVRMIREKDCVDDVALISLKYDLIDYVEKHYPEFETGVLMFAGIGNIGRLNCDVMIMEESMAVDRLVDEIHQSGKKAVTWTINTGDSMEKNFDSDVDAIITDEVALALKTQKELSERPDLEVMEGAMDSVLERTWGDLGLSDKTEGSEQISYEEF